MADQLPGAQWWEAAVNIFSDGQNQGGGAIGAFPAVPDRSTVHDPSWLTDHHFRMDWDPGDGRIWGPSWGPWRAAADYDSNIIDPKTASSAWQKFYSGAYTILNGNVHLPDWTNTAQRPTFDGTGGLYDTLNAAHGWLDTNAPTVQTMRDSVATNESTIQGQASDVIWQILDHFHTGLTSVSSQLQNAMSYLQKAGGDLFSYREALVASWNHWIGGGDPHTFTTQISGLNVQNSANLISPIGCLQAVVSALTFSQGHHHWNRGLNISVPDNFFGSNDLASWSFWQDIETAAKAVWWANTALLDAAAITTAFNTLAATYLTGPSKLQLTRPVFGALDVGNPDDTNNPNDPNSNDINNLINGLNNAFNPKNPNGPNNPNDTNIPNLPNTNGPNNLPNDPNNPNTGTPNFATTVPNPDGSANPGGGTSGFLVPNGNGGYSFEPSTDFPTGNVPAGAIPGTMVPNPAGGSTFQPSTPAASDGKPAGGTAGFLVPDGKGGYTFQPSTDFPNGNVPAGAIPGYQVPDGNGQSHFVPTAAGDTTGQPGTTVPTVPDATFTPPKVVSSGPLPEPSFDASVPATTPVGSDGLPTGGAPAADTAAPYTTPASTVDGSGAGSGGEAGATGAAGAAAQGNEVPLYPPMAGGMGGMGGMGGQQNSDRQRTTWLAEDEEVWGTESDVAPAVLGRGTGRTAPGNDEQEEYEYAPLGRARPGTDGGRTRRDAKPDRRRAQGTGDSTSVGNV